MNPALTAPTFIDLFCGCGGFSLGLRRAGLRCLAAIDFNSDAIEVFRANFPDVPHVLETDLNDYLPASLAARMQVNQVDVIVGGPPCQGFSTVRQVDAANHGSRVKRDKRRYLFRAFLDYVDYFKPRVFVMENVLGLQSAAKGKFFTLVQAEARRLGYNRGCFHDRYKRQHRDQLCSTIVAHLSKDGLMFIHPTQNRSLTPREAARVQSFPDWFTFPIARTHQFRLIGNAVPPLVAEAVGEEVKEFLAPAASQPNVVRFELSPLPKDEAEAVQWLRLVINDAPPRVLKAMDTEALKKAWYAVAFLYAGLHPDAALDHGEDIVRRPAEDYAPISRLEPRLLAPYYERSGWPVVLAPLAREAWRRFRAGLLRDNEFYCAEAQRAGMCHRSPELAEEIRRAGANL